MKKIIFTLLLIFCFQLSLSASKISIIKYGSLESIKYKIGHAGKSKGDIEWDKNWQDCSTFSKRTRYLGGYEGKIKIGDNDAIQIYYSKKNDNAICIIRPFGQDVDVDISKTEINGKNVILFDIFNITGFRKKD